MLRSLPGYRIDSEQAFPQKQITEEEEKKKLLLGGNEATIPRKNGLRKKNCKGRGQTYIWIDIATSRMNQPRGQIVEFVFIFAAFPHILKIFFEHISSFVHFIQRNKDNQTIYSLSIV